MFRFVFVLFVLGTFWGGREGEERRGARNAEASTFVEE